jgi:hypothetical protein
MGAPKGGRIERWYEEYWAQSWYRNTYLVRRPRQIARQVANERDWNNVYDSGCNFTCLAMILGLDPARLASELGRQRFFLGDREAMARDLCGRLVPLVWDQNEPLMRFRTIRLRRLWMPRLGRRVTLTLRHVGQELTFDYAEGMRIVRAARRRGHHVIAGAWDHSHLVAGRAGGDFYLWDPDDTSVSVEDSLAGRLKLRDLFDFYAGDEPIEFWCYAVERLVHRERATHPRN